MIVGVRRAPADRLCLPPGLEIAGGGPIILRFGAARARLPWVQGDDPWLGLPGPLARRLGLPLPSRLRLIWLPLRRTLRLGPTVGILVRKAPSRFGPFGPQAAFIRELMEAAGPSGEMGIDLALDRSGRIWFLETNSKLARTVFLQLGQTEVRRRSIVRPLIWAARQAGFDLSGDVLEGDAT
ncbi:MAG TPA: hypothetical protein DEQ28_03530 [Clostridiales bacterium]|nr:hypothetical protein [Clostridiales bacterium]